MNDIILSMQNGEPVVSSRQIAENFEKNHRDVLRAVDNLKEDVRNFAQMFFESTEPDSYGREQRTYLMNRDGFSLLVMGFTGKAALEWKLKYIQAFNEMEKKLRAPQIRAGNSLQALNLLVKSLNEQQDAMNRLQVNVDAQSAAIEKLEEQNELNRQAFTMNPGNWRENATAVVGKIVLKKTGGEMKGSGPVYEEVWNEIYGMMRSDFHKDMKKRKENLKKEFPRRKLSNLDVIDRAGDRNQLIGILQSVLCKMCIRYGVRLDMDKAKVLTDNREDTQTSLFDHTCIPAERFMDALESDIRGRGECNEFYDA